MNEFTVIKGNLIENALAGKYTAIAQGCNCYCTMGAGIAATIRTTFPKAESADSNTRRGDINKLGGFSYSVEDVANDGKLTVFNLYSQFGFGFKNGIPLDYEALTLSLRKMAYMISNVWKLNDAFIGLPLIGYGLAGGDLKTIIEIMYKEMKDFNVEIVVFDLEKDADVLVEDIKLILNNIIE